MPHITLDYFTNLVTLTNILVRLRGGRDLDTRQGASDSIFTAARDFLTPALQQHSFALSLEMRPMTDLSVNMEKLNAHEAGLPPGVRNLVNGLAEQAGKRLTEHPDIKAIAFVGKNSTGRISGQTPRSGCILNSAASAAPPPPACSSHLPVQDAITEYFQARLVERNNRIRARRFTNQPEAGKIWVNSESVRHLPCLFGGTKVSGIGRDGGDWSFDFYREQKHIGFAGSQT